MSALGDAADVNPVIKLLPYTCNVSGRNLITGLTSAASSRVNVLSTCCRTETWNVSPSGGILPFGVTILATVPQRLEVPEELMNYPVYIHTHIYVRVYMYVDIFIYPSIHTDIHISGHPSPDTHAKILVGGFRF
jgi:hypothetical protein